MAIQPLKRRVVDQRHATPITARWESRAMRKQFPVRTLRNPPAEFKKPAILHHFGRGAPYPRQSLNKYIFFLVRRGLEGFYTKITAFSQAFLHD